MSSKKIISDEVLYRISGGNPDGASPVDERDIWKALEQKINSLFKTRYFDTTLPSGETIPDNTMIATYENVAVTAFNQKSKSTLPVTPISLPKEMGVWLIYDANFPDMPFIPLPRGTTPLLRTDKLLSDIMGQISYERKSNTIVYNRDLTQLGTTTVTMELAVLEMSQYSITDTLPIPADMEEQIINELMAQFSTPQPETGDVNNYTTFAQQPTITPNKSK